MQQVEHHHDDDILLIDVEEMLSQLNAQTCSDVNVVGTHAVQQYMCNSIVHMTPRASPKITHGD